MSKTITFATSNARKIAEARKSLGTHDIGVVAIEVEIDEIQHHEPAEITKAKARAAYEVTHEPVVVQDTSWSIPALGGFPGGYMKDVANWWKPEDWVRILSEQDRTIICLEHIAYCDGDQVKHFESRYEGAFAEAPRGDNGNSLDKMVTLYDNGKTMAEMHDIGDVASASEGLEHWRQFAEWYKSIE
jgi:XTP/dITP diphosphohydrolase